MNWIDPNGLFSKEGHPRTFEVDYDENAAAYHIGVDRNAAVKNMERAAALNDKEAYDRNLHAWEDSFDPAHSSTWKHIMDWITYGLSGFNLDYHPDDINGRYREQYIEMNRQRDSVYRIWDNRRNRKEFENQCPL